MVGHRQCFFTAALEPAKVHQGQHVHQRTICLSSNTSTFTLKHALSQSVHQVYYTLLGMISQPSTGRAKALNQAAADQRKQGRPKEFCCSDLMIWQCAHSLNHAEHFYPVVAGLEDSMLPSNVRLVGRCTALCIRLAALRARLCSRSWVSSHNSSMLPTKCGNLRVHACVENMMRLAKLCTRNPFAHRPVSQQI